MNRTQLIAASIIGAVAIIAVFILNSRHKTTWRAEGVSPPVPRRKSEI